MIVLCGNNRNGKDTTADYLVSHHKWTKLTLATPLKQCANIIMLADYEGDAKDEQIIWNGMTARNIMITLATSLQTAFGKDIFVKILMQKITDTTNVVVSDCRFSHEVDEFIKHDATFVVISKDGLMPPIADYIQSKGSKLHVILNDSTFESLYTKIDTLLDENL